MRSLKRANSALPKSSPQKVAILGAMVADLSSSKMSTVMDSARRKVEDKTGRTKSLTEEQQKWIISFLQRPDISYTCPGRKDQMYVGKTKDGDKDYRTKYHLLWKLSEILPLINTAITESFQANEQFLVTYGTLWRLISPLKYILFQRDVPEDTCQCDYCENLQLILISLSKLSTTTNIPLTPRELLCEFLCDVQNSNCVQGDCENCGINSVVWEQLQELIETEADINFYKWVNKGKYPEKLLHTKNEEDMIVELKSQLIVYRVHQYNFVRQHKELKALKLNLPENTAVIQVDFAENYNNKQQHATQSAYFGQQCFTLFTAVIWYNVGETLKFDSFCFVTDSLEHNKYVAYDMNTRLLSEVQKRIPDVEAVHF